MGSVPWRTLTSKAPNNTSSPCIPMSHLMSKSRAYFSSSWIWAGSVIASTNKMWQIRNSVRLLCKKHGTCTSFPLEGLHLECFHFEPSYHALKDSSHIDCIWENLGALVNSPPLGIQHYSWIFQNQVSSQMTMAVSDITWSRRTSWWAQSIQGSMRDNKIDVILSH